MKKNIFSLFLILITVIVAAVIPTEAEGNIYSDTIRLHILANSDSEEDQALKLRVRDKLLLEYGEILSAFESREKAEEELSSLLNEIKDTADAFIAEEGYDYRTTVTLTEEKYETREYEGFSLPAGKYLSLRVIIGDGDGKNWWCVMYPPLCMGIASDTEPEDDAVLGYTDSEYALITGSEPRYRIKFKLLELIDYAFG